MSSLLRTPFRALALAPKRSAAAAAAASTLVIVESTDKAERLQGILGGTFVVTSSHGHVRELQQRRWAVDPTHNFELHWQPRSQYVLDELFKSARISDRVLLASDPGSEGEASAWHLAQLCQART